MINVIITMAENVNPLIPLLWITEETMISEVTYIGDRLFETEIRSHKILKQK